MLVKTDAEGYDKQIIQGAMETLRRAVGCIVEVHLSLRQAGQTTLGEMMQLLVRAVPSNSRRLRSLRGSR
jgi:hypothetical protein